MKKNNHSIIKGIAVGAGIATVAAAIAGTYFLYGSKNASKNRKKVKAWTFKAKGEILEQLENLSEVSEGAYHKIIKDVSNKYQELKNIDKNDITEFTEELKSHWKNIAKEIGIPNKKINNK
jgi:gas vesicle protein